MSQVHIARGQGRSAQELAQLDRSVKPELRLGKQVCQCADCHLYFTGVQPFDRHLDRNDDSPMPPRCLTPTEMRTIGMATNSHGVWQYGKAGKKEDLLGGKPIP